jgi:hypothetical protein
MTVTSASATYVSGPAPPSRREILRFLRRGAGCATVDI